MSVSTAERLHSVEEYYFSKKLREVRELTLAGKPIINMAIGSPDLAPPKAVIEALSNTLNIDGAHKYQSYQGLPELRETIGDFYKNKYGASFNTNSEVLPLMGSKEGIMHISMAFLNKGDQVLIPNPGYPTYTSVTKLLEAEPVFYNLSENNNWEPDLEALGKLDLSKVKIMWVNYPHMPTGAAGSKALFEKLIAFAKKNNILLVNDNPYSFVLNDNPLSIFSVPDAKQVALELNSLSKTFNMAGWRVGMLLGKKETIDAVLKVKSNMDSGMFQGLQKGAIAALNCEESWYQNLNTIYAKRRKLIWQLSDLLGCTYDCNATGMFVWSKLPNGITNAEAFIDQILYKKSVFITPGSIFGSQGKNYIRFSLCIEESKIQEAIERLKDFKFKSSK